MEEESNLADNLRQETIKWLERIEKEVRRVELNSEMNIEIKIKDYLENINAYINDCKWFMEKGDLIRAFECVVWAWAWLEIGIRLGVLSTKNSKY